MDMLCHKIKFMYLSDQKTHSHSMKFGGLKFATSFLLTRSDFRDSESICPMTISHVFQVVIINSGETIITVLSEFFNP